MTHLSASDVSDFRARKLDRARVEAIGAHVRECSECTRRLWSDHAIVESAEAIWKPERRRPRWRAVAVWAAAAAAIIVAILVWTRRDEPGTAPMVVRKPEPVVPRTPATRVVRDGAVAITLDESGAVRSVATQRPEWDALVAEALRSGKPPASSAAALVGTAAVLRGDGVTAPAVTLLEPVAVVVEPDRPRFRWTEVTGGRYRVLVALDGALVARSEPQPGRTWVPPAPLTRGQVYAWQLAVTIDGREWIVPPPDARPARFRVLGDDEVRELDAARATGSRLLTGLVAARLGLTDLAGRELNAFAAEQRDLPVARTLASRYERPAPTTTNADQ